MAVSSAEKRLKKPGVGAGFSVSENEVTLLGVVMHTWMGRLSVGERTTPTECLKKASPSHVSS
jgi:hypothetical protein